MPKVNSTAIARIRPTGPSRFRVLFHEGREYEVEAPRSVYRELRNARSVGATYNRKVRGKFPTVLVSN